MAEEKKEDGPSTHDPRSYRADSDTPPEAAKSERDQAEDRKPAEDDKAKTKMKGPLQRPVTLVAAGLTFLILLVVVVISVLHARHFQSTDDAFIDTHIVRVAPRISGRVSSVLVDDNQIVKAGQKLIEIDPRDEQARLDQARAQDAQADAQIAQARAQLLQIDAQVKVSQANFAQQVALTAANAAQATNAARDLIRYQTLKAINPAAVAQQQLDQSTAQARSTSAQRVAAARQADSARQQIAATETQRAAARAQIAAGQAQKQNAQATIRSAQLELSYTGVEAPVAGTVTQRTVAAGAYLNAGAQIMAIVPLRTWVTANFKETQLELMRAGQTVSINVDACPHARISGHVDSIQRGSGQAFGILPPENATGNFVKVVQRVPVKILIDNAPRDCPLGPGLSVEPKVRVQ